MKLFLFALLMLITARPSHAQGIFVGAGLGGGSVPRATESLCGGTPDALKGLNITAQLGKRVGPVDVALVTDYVSRPGYHVIADCVIRNGVYTDSVFDGAKGNARSLALELRIPLGSLLHLSAGAGRVFDHSWMVSTGAGARVSIFSVELAARMHEATFDEIVRDYRSTGTTIRSQSRKSEMSWGWVTRIGFTKHF